LETPVTFQAHGTQVVGILHTRDNEQAKSPAILFLHGFTATKSESHRLFVKAARELARAGMTSLRFDFRGWGDSGGESEESSISTMVEDARVATDFLLSQHGVDANRLGYIGMSTGGAAAALATGHDPRVKSLALWNAVADGRQIIGNLVTPQRVQSLAASGRADYNGNMISQRFVQEFTVMQPAATLARRPIPTLLVQAGKDMSVHPSQVEIYEQALQEKAARVGKFLLADADHIFSSIAWERKVIEQTVKWFGQVL
jgi:dipeptidyl aminopeptidase/acylaminoacyl peptidase